MNRSILLAIVTVTALSITSCRSGHNDQASSPDTAMASKSGKTQGRKCPADKVTIDGRDILDILKMLGAELEPGATDKQLLGYTKHFNRQDTDRDGKHSKKEYIDNGVHMNPQARRGIFGAADNNGDGWVTKTEYVLNRIITDEAKGIVQATDADKDGKITKAEFVNSSPLKDKRLAAKVYDALDTNDDGTITIPEYLRVWGKWARPNYKKQEAAIEARLKKIEKGDSAIRAKASTPTKKSKDKASLKGLWSHGLTSRRTGEPLIEEGGEHKIDKSKVSYGHNIVVDRNDRVLSPGGRPLQGGEQLMLTKEHQKELNVREYARVVSIMAPIRDAILYNFNHTSRKEWLKLTQVLRINNIKTKDAPTITPRNILSIEQVYDYVASNPTEGSPVMRFLEEAELELKCLAFVGFDFTNPEGRNHAKEHNIKVGSGIKMP